MTDEERAAYLARDESAGYEPGALPAGQVAALDDLRTLLGEGAVWAEPPADLGERVVAAVTSARAIPAPAAGSARVLTFRRATRQHWLLLSAAAAVVAIAVAIALVVGTDSGSSTQQRFAANLTGTALAPRASGDVTLTKTTSGWRIELHTVGLPRRDSGRYYEAWLKNADGTLVPVGTFNNGENVTLWSAVSPADFTTFTITRQVVGGGEDSSGQVVLAGTSMRA